MTKLQGQSSRLWTAVVLALAAVAVAPVAAQAASDVPLATGWATDGTVFATTVDGSGRTYLGGSFTHVYAPTIGGLKLTTSSDHADLTFPQVNNTLLAVASDGAGGWFLGGFFTAVGGVTRNHLAHILSDGSLDPTWDPNANGNVNALAVSGSDVYVGGDFTTVNGSTTRNHLAKIPISGNGTVDASWDPNANSTVRALAVSGSDVYVGGNFTTLNIPATVRNRLAKIPTAGTGTVDASWNPNVNGEVDALAVSGSDLYVGGGFSTMNGATARVDLAKIPISGDGTVDASWDPHSNGTVSALAVSGSDVYVGGNFSTLNGGTAARLFLAKIPAAGDGTVDPSWAPNANNIVYALAVAGADVYVGGFFTTLNGGTTARNFLAKIPAAGDGTVDASWDPNPNNIVHALATSGSDVYAGGELTRANVTTRNRLARLNADGSLDASWDPNANDSVVRLALSGSDLYVGGIFTTLNGSTTRNRLAKIPTTGDGTVDASWDPNANDQVGALAVSGSAVYVGGIFTTLNGSTTRNHLAKIPTAGSGTVDASWDPNVSAAIPSTVRINVLTVSATDVYVGGVFTTLNGSTTRNRLAKIPLSSPSGTVDPSWDPSPNGLGVNALAVSGTDVYVGGSFTTIGGQSRNRIAKLSSTGTGAADPSWDPNAGIAFPGVSALAVSGSDVYVGGTFTTIGGQSRNRIARLSSSGTGAADPTWNPNADSGVSALAISGTRLAAGGTFTTVGTRSNQGVALFTLLAVPTLTTTASPDVALGGSVHATATLAGGSAPTGTIAFTLYGPDDASCSNAAAFTDTQGVASGNGDYDSANFTPSQPGTYRWTAAYSGDANNDPAATSCDDPDGEVVVVAGPDLTVAKSHSGDFMQGQTGATYTIAVTNVGSAATSGTVTVTDTLPAGLAPTAPSGVVAGWTCGIAGQTVTCTRSDALGVGASYPAIALTVDVAADAAAAVTNIAQVSGGGESNTANDSASDPTTVTQLSPGVTVDPTSGLTTTEAGGTDTFTVVLDSPPSGDVVIDLASTDLTEGTVSPAQLTFTGGAGGDWATPRTVTVTGVDDATEDGDQAYGITVAIDAALTDDPAYDALDPTDVAVTNLDDEAPGNAIFADGFESGDTDHWSTGAQALLPLACDEAGAAPDRSGDPFGACAVGAGSPDLAVTLAAPPLRAFSLVGWVQLGQLGRRPETLLALTDAGGRLELGVDTGGGRGDRLRVDVALPDGGRATSDPLGPRLVNFHWYHLALVYDGSAGTLDYYLDGELQARLTGMPTALRAQRASFGSGPGGALDGAFDDAHWAAYRLSAEEVAARAAAKGR